MPLQCGICEGIRIVPMLLDVLTLRRNKFRDPRIMGTKRVKSRKEATYNQHRTSQMTQFFKFGMCIALGHSMRRKGRVTNNDSELERTP